MVRIRLKRVGGKKHPFYRVVIADQRAARDGAFIEQIGTYDPFPDPPEIKIDEEKVTKWIKDGAQPSESVTSLLQSIGFLPKVSTPAPVEEAPKAAAKPAKKAAAKPAPKAAATATAVAEAPVATEEEAPADEAVAEEAPVATEEEEAPADEAVAEDAPAEEAAAEEAEEESTSG
ncbi:MAG TPA: 30S ribosomal protein S16 [Dehalococcoidia bacterium]|jgi:small subunit ribosomal protein S16|nr:30S ribosomal protein S16 [Dehalococcoidia bacterium]HIK88467.1 30S ribosomal protein S16 [Dehalococcoidia bacterium]